MYVELIVKGDSEGQVMGAIEDKLDEMFGAENYETHEIREMTEDEIIEYETGINDDYDVGVPVDDSEILEQSVEMELDDMEIRRDEMISDELGS